MVDEIGDEVVITMNVKTAWSTPNVWLQSMRIEFPNLRFALYCTEESYEFGGYETYDGDSKYITPHEYKLCVASINRDDFVDEYGYYDAQYEEFDKLDEKLFDEFAEMIVA